MGSTAATVIVVVKPRSSSLNCSYRLECAIIELRRTWWCSNVMSVDGRGGPLRPILTRLTASRFHGELPAPPGLPGTADDAGILVSFYSREIFLHTIESPTHEVGKWNVIIEA